jgi:hypothetical protein
MVAGYAELIRAEQFVVAEARNHLSTLYCARTVAIPAGIMPGDDFGG